MDNRALHTSGGDVCAIVVTYNRLELLQASVAALRSQTAPIGRLVIVDNGSTDATPKWLEEQRALASDESLIVITQANSGSAGGFATGIGEAMRTGGEPWLWCMDDDTVPEPA